MTHLKEKIHNKKVVIFKKRTGFTLIELLVVVAIIGILAAAGLAAYSAVLKNARDSKRKADLNIIRGALENYYADQKYYPYTSTGTNSVASGQVLNSATGGVTGASSSKIYLNSIPADPINTGNYTYVYKAYKSNGTTDCPDNETATDRCVKYCLAANLENPPTTGVSTCTVSGYNFGLTAP